MLWSDEILGDALPYTDVMHANLEEAARLTGEDAQVGIEPLRRMASKLLQAGVGIVIITLGKDGGYVKVTHDAERLRACQLLQEVSKEWRGQECYMPAFAGASASALSA